MAEAAVKSPCVNICALDEQDVCTGCYRSVAEIAGWSTLDDDARRAVLARADARYRAAWGDPGGRRRG